MPSVSQLQLQDMHEAGWKTKTLANAFHRNYGSRSTTTNIIKEKTKALPHLRILIWDLIRSNIIKLQISNKFLTSLQILAKKKVFFVLWIATMTHHKFFLLILNLINDITFIHWMITSITLVSWHDVHLRLNHLPPSTHLQSHTNCFRWQAENGKLQLIYLKLLLDYFISRHLWCFHYITFNTNC